MIIYTTYFNNLINLSDNIIPISICLKPPYYWRGREYKKLAPKASFFSLYKSTGDINYFTEEFNKQVLNQLNPVEVVSDLFKGIPNDCTIALLCYERPNQFCHRQLVAKWLIDNGYKVLEYN